MIYNVDPFLSSPLGFCNGVRSRNDRLKFRPKDSCCPAIRTGYRSLSLSRNSPTGFFQQRAVEGVSIEDEKLLK